MKIAFVFPGQGVRISSFQTDLLTRSKPVRELIEHAAGCCSIRSLDVFANGGALLQHTEIYQPILTALALGIHEELRCAGVAPDIVAGHSLGEIAAWAAVGGIAPERAIEIAALRGRLMAREALNHPGGMLALTDCDEEEVRDAVDLGRLHGCAYIAAINAPREWVLAGEMPALRQIAARFGGSFLPVDGPWHGPLMEGAVDALREAISRMPMTSPRVDFISNRTGRLVEASQKISDVLAEQLVLPTQWSRVMQTMEDASVTDVVAVGPGKVLRGIVRKNLLASVRVHLTETCQNLKNTIEILGQ